MPKECSHRKGKRQKFIQRLCTTFLILLFLILFVILLVWAILKPHKPHFILQDASTISFDSGLGLNRELNTPRQELLSKLQNLKQDLQNWRFKLDSQVKTYRPRVICWLCHRLLLQRRHSTFNVPLAIFSTALSSVIINWSFSDGDGAFPTSSLLNSVIGESPSSSTICSEENLCHIPFLQTVKDCV